MPRSEPKIIYIDIRSDDGSLEYTVDLLPGGAFVVSWTHGEGFQLRLPDDWPRDQRHMVIGDVPDDLQDKLRGHICE